MRLLVDIELAARALPQSLCRRLAEFRDVGHEHGILLIRGVPVGDGIPPTPRGGQFEGPWKQLAIAGVAQLMVMSWLGGVISYSDEKAGRLIQDICPVPGAEDLQENTGTRLLEMHTEDGFHPHRPDFLSLLCLRPDHERRALTLAAGVRSFLGLLTPECVKVLREPLFRLRFSSSFTSQTRYSQFLPVLSGPESDPDLCLDLHGMESEDARGIWALSELREAVLASLVGVALQTGDLLIIDNRLAAHGRTGFRARHDGQDRWLRRCYVHADLRQSRGLRDPGSRVHRPVSI